MVMPLKIEGSTKSGLHDINKIMYDINKQDIEIVNVRLYGMDGVIYDGLGKQKRKTSCK